MAGFIPGERSFNTRAVATVYRHGRGSIPLVGAQTLRPHEGGPVALVSMTTKKSLGNASGEWSLGFKEGSLDVEEEILPGDWVVLHWERNGKKLSGMLGIIDNVARARRSKAGLTLEDWTVTGRDHGRIFEITQAFFDPYTNLPVDGNAGGQALASPFNYIPGGTPDQIVENIIMAWLGRGDTPRGIVGGAWVFPTGLEYLGTHFTEGLQIVVGGNEPIKIGVIQEPPNLRGKSFNEAALFQPSPQTVMQDMLLEWSNPILNELYYDVVTGGTVVFTQTDTQTVATSLAEDPTKPIPGVFIRERPFINANEGSESPWFSIPALRLPRDAIETSNVSKNDQERLNYFILNMSGIGIKDFENILAYPPSFDRESLARHGLRKWERVTRFYDDVDPKTELAKWHHLVTSWYGSNHEWLSGTVSVPFILPEARVGMRLLIGNDADTKREQYYVEDVETTWRFPNHGGTTMGVTRGWRGDDGDLVSTVVENQERFFRREDAPIVDADTAAVSRFSLRAAEPIQPVK